MLRPSRPMMRPFSSSDLSSTTDTVVSTAWLDATRCITAARMLRARRSASLARLLLHLPDQAGAVVAQLVLELAHQDLLRLAGAQAGHPLELAQLPRLLGLQLLARVVQVAPPVVERALALARAPAPAARASSPSRAAAPPAAPARSGARAAPPRGRRADRPGAPPPAGAAVAAQARRAAPASRTRLRTVARALHEHHHRHRDTRRDQRRQHDLHLRLLTRRTAAPTQHSVSLSGAARGRETPDIAWERARALTGAHGAASRDPPERSFRAGRSRWSGSMFR